MRQACRLDGQNLYLADELDPASFFHHGLHLPFEFIRRGFKSSQLA